MIGSTINTLLMITKICRKCNKKKKASEFPKGRDANGLYYICKPCKVDNNTQLYRSKDPLTRWVDVSYCDIKGRAKRNELSFSLTKDFLREKFTFQNGKCIYCDNEFDMNGTQTDKRKSPSVDRVIPTKGYVLSNVVLCCYRCNAIKQDASLSELTKLVEVLKRITTTDQNSPS